MTKGQKSCTWETFMKINKLRLSVSFLLVGLLLATISCNQTPQTEQPPDIVQESEEIAIIPSGPDSGARAPTLIVRLAIVRQDADHRFGEARFFWTDTSGSTLNGTANVRLREAGSSTTLTETIDAPISSNANLYADPNYKNHLAQTPVTTVKRAICLEVTSWNLSTDNDDGDDSFNNQIFPLTLCVKNSIENSADMAIKLDANSQTNNIVVEEEFPFIIGIQNLGPKSAFGVIVDVLLPDSIDFVKDQSNKYICAESNTNSASLRCVANGDVPTGYLGLPIILRGTSTSDGNNIVVSVEASSTDPNDENNSFNQTVSIIESCTVVSIPDATLEAAIRDELNIFNGPICEADMLLLTTLSVPDGGIVNLKGLQHATNLLSLSLPLNHTQDVSLRPLAGLTKLTYLDLSQTRVDNLGSIRELINLEVLNLTESNLDNSDLTHITKLMNLNELWLTGNKITDITKLVSNAGLGTGDSIYLDGNCLDTSGPPDLTDIQTLQERGASVVYDSQRTCP